MGKGTSGTSRSSDADVDTRVPGASAVEAKVIKPKEERKVTITFRQNRKFDLRVGRETLTFEGTETKSIPAKWLSHPDFMQASKYFVIKGV